MEFFPFLPSPALTNCVFMVLYPPMDSQGFFLHFSLLDQFSSYLSFNFDSLHWLTLRQPLVFPSYQNPVWVLAFRIGRASLPPSPPFFPSVCRQVLGVWSLSSRTAPGFSLASSNELCSVYLAGQQHCGQERFPSSFVSLVRSNAFCTGNSIFLWFSRNEPWPCRNSFPRLLNATHDFLCHEF